MFYFKYIYIYINMVPPLDIHLGTTFPWALVRRPPWHHLNCGEYGVTVFLCGHCLSLHHHWGCRLPEGPPPMTPPDAFVPATPPGPPPLGALPLTPPEAWWPESPPHTPEGAWQTCYCGCLSNQPSRLMFSLSMHTSISTCFCWLIVTRLERHSVAWLALEKRDTCSAAHLVRVIIVFSISTPRLTQ
jgi:hypothetical protein